MGRFFKVKKVYFPTILGWLIILIGLFVFSFFLIKMTYTFLSQEVKPNSKVLVVEGWIPQYGIKNAIDYYNEHGYKYMIITGVPITQWTYSSPFSNMADASAGTMRHLFFTDSIYTVSIPTSVFRDRTYSTAVALKMALPEWSISDDNFDLYSLGAHARRSYLMFSKVFSHSDIGLITDTDKSFEAEEWYSSSNGFRIVFSELISYFYSRLFFYPDENHYQQLILSGRYFDSITDARYEKDRTFADTVESPLNKNDVLKFKGLEYFEIDLKYHVLAGFEVDTSEAPFSMPTTTERKPVYRKFGTVRFMLHDSIFSLTAYQNLDYLTKNPDSKQLFIPFKDLTNSFDSYGGGRYLDIDIPSTDSVRIDFNKAYNPFCAYDERWSCPLPPPENYINTLIKAGEKKYKR